MCDIEVELCDIWGSENSVPEGLKSYMMWCCVTGQVLLMFQDCIAFVYGVKQSKKNNHLGQSRVT
jgi:hypothetical protein